MTSALWRRATCAAALVGAALVASAGGTPAVAPAHVPAAMAHDPESGDAPALLRGGCAQVAEAGTISLSLRIDSHERIVLVHVPRRYTGRQPVPLVLNLHGSESDAAQQEALSGMDATADTDGFIVAYPQADIPSGPGYDWNVPNEPLVSGALPPKNAPNDVSFLEQLVITLESRYCIDSSMVYLSGFSGGARMASQLACDAPTVFAAVAAVSGLRFPSPCPGTRAVPVIAFHGTADPVDPFEGHGFSYWTYSVPTAARLWAVHDGCTSTPKTTKTAKVVFTAYGNCRNGAKIELYALVGEGHEWPGGPILPRAITKVLGAQSEAVNADSVMLSFFRAHPLSSPGRAVGP
ncbi:MAG TPA: PHB depolymerase family esterase [Acidimicrobiales bacterium]|nr:PHB depolymerase family esterase [Acidimicrobiales bacterium]